MKSEIFWGPLSEANGSVSLTSKRKQIWLVQQLPRLCGSFEKVKLFVAERLAKELG